MNYSNFKDLSHSEKNEFLEEAKFTKNIDNLILALSDKDIEISGKASEILISFGKVSVFPLLVKLNTNNTNLKSWCIVTLGEIKSRNLIAILYLLRLSFFDPSEDIRKKAFHAFTSCFSNILKSIKRIIDLFFFYIFFAIVQMVTLIFLLAPFLAFAGKYIPLEYTFYKNIISALILSTIIPFASGYLSTYYLKLKKDNYAFISIIGIVMVIPYNIILTLITNHFNVANIIIPIIGLFGAVAGHYTFVSEKIESTYTPQELIYEDSQKSILGRIFRHLKFTKSLQDNIIIISGLIGLIIFIFIAFSLYNISSINKNRKHFNIEDYKDDLKIEHKNIKKIKPISN